MVLNRKVLMVCFKLGFLLCGFLAIGHVAQAGFGVSPPSIVEDRLVPGARIERIIYLVQGNPERDIEMGIVVDSPNIKDWITFESGETFVIPQGVQQFPLKVRIQVPQGVDLGIYKAFIRVNTVPKKATQDGEVAIALGGLITVDLTVGDEVFQEYSIRSIEIKDIRSGKNPEVEVRIENSGNVSVAPAAASFELFNKFGNVRLAYSESTAFTPVKPFSEETIKLLFPIEVRLAEGEYWGHVRVYDDDNQVIKELRTVFNVNPGLPISGNWLIGGLIGAVIIVIAFVLFILRRRKNKYRKLSSQSTTELSKKRGRKNVSEV